MSPIRSVCHFLGQGPFTGCTQAATQRQKVTRIPLCSHHAQLLQEKGALVEPLPPPEAVKAEENHPLAPGSRLTLETLKRARALFLQKP